jgi:hypothetical protein
MFKNRVVVSPIEIVRQRNRVILTGSRRFIQHHDPVGVPVRQRAQQNRINDAENRGVRANAERQRQDRDRAETRLLPQHAESISNILFHIARVVCRRKAKIFVAINFVGSRESLPLG